MARLGGDFAALFLISVVPDKSDSLRQSLEKLSRESHIIVTKFTSHPVGWLDEYISYSLDVAGTDHEGIIHEIARFLAERGINIAKMETSVQNSPNSGTPIFSMLAVIQVPPDVLPEDLNHRLSLLGDQLAVDITLRMVERSG